MATRPDRGLGDRMSLTRGPDRIPVFGSQPYFQGLDGLAQTLDPPGAGDRIRSAGMPKNPGVGERCKMDVQASGDRAHFIAYASGRVIGALEQPAARERRPDHRASAELLRLVERAVVQCLQHQRR